MPVRPVTVIVTCFNERELVVASIESVLAQSAVDKIDQIIVIDDGSTDGTEALLDDIAANNSLVRVEHISNRGISGARNHGLALVVTPLVAFLDGDDLWHREKLAWQLEAIDRSNGRAALWFTGFVEFDERDGKHRTPARVHDYREDATDTLARFFVLDGPIIPSSVVAKTSALRDAGGFSEEIRLFEDMDLWLHLAALGYSFQRIAEPLVFKRRRAGGLSARVEAWDEWVRTIEARWVERRPELRALVKRRRAVRAGRLAQACFSRGHRADGWRHIGVAFRHDPFVLDNYVYGMLGVLPDAVRAKATGAITKARHVLTRALERKR